MTKQNRKNIPLHVCIPPDLKRKLDKHKKDTGRDTSELARELFSKFLDSSPEPLSEREKIARFLIGQMTEEEQRNFKNWLSSN